MSIASWRRKQAKGCVAVVKEMHTKYMNKNPKQKGQYDISEEYQSIKKRKNGKA